MTTILPAPALRPYVSFYQIQEMTEESVYTVYPGTSVVMGFQYKGKLSIVQDNSVTALSRAGVTGLGDTFKMFRSSANIGTILVFFSDAGAPAFLDCAVHELFGGSYSLKDIHLQRRVNEVEEKLAGAMEARQRIAIIDSFLISLFRQPREDKMVSHALSMIRANHGNIRMSALSSELNISIGQMEKRFRRMVGATPKKYASIVRFNEILKGAPDAKSLVELACKTGYFDQAHFIKDFKSFTGQTPEQYFISRGNAA
jgi:AraC-like DNA-binding protein